MRSPRPIVRSLFVLAAVVLVLDQLTKAWAEATLTVGERVPVVGDLLGLVLVHNPGAALSLATGLTWVLTVVAAVVVVVIVRFAGRLGSRSWAVALGLLLGGALGNLADRLLRAPGFARGHVVDFIAYADWFVGNVADIAIVVAAGLIVLLSLRGVGIDGSREGDRSATDGDVADGGAVDGGAADGDVGDGAGTDPAPEPAPGRVEER